jgi:ubiquinone biosynthesis O-methyltransferase
MVTLGEIQKYERNKSRGLKKDFESLNEKINEISKIIKKYQKGKMKKRAFQETILWDLAIAVSNTARLANSAKVDLSEQFMKWQYFNKDSAKKMGTSKGYDEISKIYDDPTNFVIVAEHNKIIQLIGNVKGKKVLDVGCGTGRYSIPLAKKGAEVHGIDISKGMLRLAKRNSTKLKIDFQIGNMLKIPFKKDTFDVVISNLAIDHVKDHRKALSEMQRVCKPGGKVIISTVHTDLIGGKGKREALFIKAKVSVVSYGRREKDFKQALKNKVKNLRFYNLTVPKSAERLDSQMYRWCKHKHFVLAMKFFKK